ncbi:MAG: TetR/AcrR family transcriptional regulator; helix-turn-helix transcriptional regulator [Actinobacteria bacterium]|nr:TetR/AcrR family transcriptional regulator; helix-turn-helix transcriptional regulator [Actinomycetota bacterium]MBW3647893.1 TetR/AcrR family transcriptional regulator; helix-turn-helix transcriptional regulator [Actinomycetota bacterium]
MTSQRHMEDPLLTAARACILEVGLRRTTLADVARRAGVSRMTVYRQYGDLSAIVAALLTAELLGLLDEAREQVSALPTARERLVSAGVRVVEQLAVHPLWCKVLDLDPELLLPLVVDRFGSSQRAAVDQVAEQVELGQRDGSIRDGDPQLLATCLLLTAQSFVFSARVIAAEHKSEQTGPELRRLLEGYLRP